MANLKHSAAGAERRLSTGENLTGIAKQAEDSIATELANDGIVAVYKKRFTRLQAVSDLYYAAILGAKNMDDLDKFVQRYGWLQGSALRALVVLKDMEAEHHKESLNQLLGKVDK